MRLMILTVIILIGYYALTSPSAHADPQGTWWQDPDTGAYTMVDPQSHVTVSGCSGVTYANQ